jgi:SNF2 family DNA or RNA helicase
MISIMLQVLPGAMSITGSVVAKKRQTIIDEFNGGKGSILILSTKVGGVGITLTSATRAIIYEPSWNPADDRQAVDRIYRIGQNKPCTIYRFLSSGTVEERMYEKQVRKGRRWKSWRR